MSDINPGDAVRLSVAFTDADGDAADPTTVTLRLRRKRGATTTYVYGTDEELVKDSTGNYHLDYTVPEIAPHHGMKFLYEWTGTGAVSAVEPGNFVVSDPYG